MPGLLLRPALDSDGHAVLSIMAECFLQFPGCYFDFHENSDVASPASTYARKGGVYYILEALDGRIEACAGVKRATPSGVAPATADWELSRFYVRPLLQAAGVGTRLFNVMMAFVLARGGGSVIAWSDTRFTGAHAFYQKHGMQKLDLQRPLHDVSQSLEYAFYKEI